MSVRSIVCAFAVLASVEAAVIVPKFSTAQQLAETAAAVSIHGRLQGAQNTKAGFGAVNKARALSKNSNKQLAYGNEAFGDGETAVRPTTQSTSSRPGNDLARFDASHPVVGKRYRTSGIVILDKRVGTQRVVFLLQLDKPNHYEVLGFKLSDPTLPEFPKQAQVEVTGTYAAKIKEPETGSMVHGFDNAVFQAPQSQSAVAPGPAMDTQPALQPEPAKEDKPTFDSVLKGWTFCGTVEVMGQTTGVFTNEGAIKYAHPGTKLGEDVKVVSLSTGYASLTVAGKPVEVAPWADVKSSSESP